MPGKVLFIDKVHPLVASGLTAAGYVCDHLPGLGREEVAAIIPQYSGIIVRSGIRIDRPLLDLAESLEFIGRVGSGMENVDVETATARGIRCINSPEGNRDAVGEHATGLLLALLRNTVRADRQVRNGQWLREPNRGTEIMGKTVGIIGYGNMGSAFAQRLSGFGAEVISYDKYKTGYSDGNTRETGMEELFSRSDIVSLHVPLTEETMAMADASFIGKFAKSIWLVNTSRGKVVNTPHLAEALRSGKVLGAALDVLEYEDTTFEQIARESSPDLDYLKTSDKVILTPHIAGWTHESAVKLATVLVGKILKNQ